MTHSKSAGKKEKIIENQIKTFLKSNNYYFFKNHGNIWTEAGRPDIVACCNGRFVAIEVKREKGGVISEAQKVHERKIKKNEGIHIYATSVKDVMEGLKCEL